MGRVDGELKKGLIKKKEELARTKIHANSAEELLMRDIAVNTIIKSKISGIPSTGFISFLFKRGETEYTTTFINAVVSIHEGGFNYSIQDFRIGRVKIPALFISKFSEGNRTLKGIYLTKLEIQGDSLYLERR